MADDDIPRIGDPPPTVPPIHVYRYPMPEALAMPAYMVQEVLDELEPDLQAVLAYKKMLHDVLLMRRDIEAAEARAADT